MKRILVLASLLICSSVYADKACMVEIKTMDDLNVIHKEMGCKKGDYFSAYTVTRKKRRQLRMQSAMMAVCDLSLPFSFHAFNYADNMNITFSCTLSGESREIVLGKDAKRDMH
jgi:hypothetical protein